MTIHEVRNGPDRGRVNKCAYCGYPVAGIACSVCSECGARLDQMRRSVVVWRAGALLGTLCAVPIGHHVSMLAMLVVETSHNTRMGSRQLLIYHSVCLVVAVALARYWITEAAPAAASSRNKRNTTICYVVCVVAMDTALLPLLRWIVL